MTNGLLIALVALAAPILALGTLSLLSRRAPQLGVRDGKLLPCPASPNCVSSQAADDEHRVEPLHFADAPGVAWARLIRLVADQPRFYVIQADDEYVRIEATSKLFRFVDDVEFLLDAPNQLIHCRSASRVGHSDLGVNRRRIETIRSLWERSP